MSKTAVFQNPIFQDETEARKALEAVRWPDGAICPHCGNSDQEKLAKVEGAKKSHRPGLYYCNECKGQFTVTVGTVFERSKVPLTKWWMAAHLMNSNKNGVSAHEIHRNLGVTYKTAWFMMHRLREAMTDLTAKGSIWGRIYCPHHSRDGCRISVWSTPRVPESHAKDIRRIVDRCNHDGE